MSEKMTTRLAYLDHNILDSILKGDRKDIRGFLRTQGFIPVFSNENLAEIHRSRGYEQQFLQLLKELGAKHLSPEFDRDFRRTGRAFVKEVDPYEAYAQWVGLEFPWTQFWGKVTPPKECPNAKKKLWFE